jgi:hypothetical protein
MSAEAMAAILAALQAELAGVKAEAAAKVAALEDALTGLAHENALLKRRLYGNRTERSRTSELQLAIGDLLADETKLQAELDAPVAKAEEDAPPPTGSPKPGTPRPHGRRNLFASKLPRVVVEIHRRPESGQRCQTGRLRNQPRSGVGRASPESTPVRRRGGTRTSSESGASKR